jgi:uncharacterized protein YdhG (YjbR/CyaY superfamily)
MRSSASDVDAYLAELPDERRAVLTKLRAFVRRHLPKGYVEAMTWGLPGYEVPLARHPHTYNGKPLSYVAFAAQKNAYSLYLTCVYTDPKRAALLREGAAAAGLKLDMGKSCLRFRSLDDLPLDTIGQLIAGLSVDEFIAHHDKIHPRIPIAHRAPGDLAS